MRSSTVTSFTANGQSSPSFTLLSGDTLAMVVAGSGNMTIALQYQAELASGAPWVDVPLENGTSTVTVTGTTQAVRVIRGLPRGFYRLTTTAWTSGTKEGYLLAY